jgi:hypothetical protein
VRTIQRETVQMADTHQFRTAYVLKPGFDFLALAPHCKRIVYCTDGVMNDIDALLEQLSEAFANFDPEQDCVIPVGTAVANLLAGSMISQRHPGKSVHVGMFRKEHSDTGYYTFYRVPLDQLI